MGAVARVKQYIDAKGISKYKFYQETGLSNGSLDKGENLGSDKCERIIYAYPDINIEWLLTGRGEMTRRIADPQNNIATAIETQDVKKGIPLIPYEAFCGFGLQSFEDLRIEKYYDIEEFKNADFMIRVKGSSMYPKYSSGDIIACKRIEEILYFQWNKIYAIYTKSQGIMVKRVKKAPDQDHITLVSDNPKYEPFEIPISDIQAIALVIGVIRIES